MSAFVERDDNRGIFIKIALTTLNNQSTAAETIQKKFNLLDAPNHLLGEGKTTIICIDEASRLAYHSKAGASN